MHEVYTLLDGEEQAASCKLKDSLDQLHQSNQISYMIVFTVSYVTWLSIPGCVDFALIHKIGGTVVSLPGKTKLDKERRNQCLTEIVRSFYKKNFLKM